MPRPSPSTRFFCFLVCLTHFSARRMSVSVMLGIARSRDLKRFSRPYGDWELVSASGIGWCSSPPKTTLNLPQYPGIRQARK